MQAKTIVESSRIEMLQKKVESINRKATKIGMRPITMIVTDSTPLYLSCFRGDYYKTEEPDEHWLGVEIPRSEVTLDGEAPCYEGWKFVATLSPTENGNLINTVPDYTRPLTEYVDRMGECDHCNQKRNRKETFVVEHENGEIKMVGRSCLKDFMGHMSPQQLADYAQFWMSLEKMDDEESDIYGNDARMLYCVSLEKWLTASAAMIRINGFVSNKVAKDGEGYSTSMLVTDYFFPPKGVKRQELPITEEDEIVGKKTLSWMLNASESLRLRSNYMSNLHVIATNGYVNSNGFGLATSAVFFYLKELAESKVTNPSKSVPVGKQGDRLCTEVTVMAVRPTETYYGNCGVHTLQDDNGNQFVWFASNSAVWLETGRKYRVSARVKNHQIYRSIHQTVVTHVKVLDTIAVPDAVSA